MQTSQVYYTSKENVKGIEATDITEQSVLLNIKGLGGPGVAFKWVLLNDRMSFLGLKKAFVMKDDLDRDPSLWF